jgi:hypothetical protein
MRHNPEREWTIEEREEFFASQDALQLNLTPQELSKLSDSPTGERVEAGVYEWIPGKALKDCRIGDITPKVVARRDVNKFACAIDIDGITILHLNPGTERNEICADLIAEALESLDDARTEKIMEAVGAYRFLGKLKRDKA